MANKERTKHSMPITFALADMEIDERGRVVVTNKHLAQYVKDLKKKRQAVLEAEMRVDYTDAQCLCMCNCA